MSVNSSRRSFLAASAAALAAPYWFATARADSANERPGIAAIGVGGRGSGIGHAAASRGNMVACADVDRTHAEKFASRYQGKCQVYTDYRKLLERRDIDVVTIGTPDHWHAKICIEALRSGRDVYCEKPLTLTIDEGRRICKAVEATGRVMQVGTQQRSEYKQMFLQAVALARSGRLGKNLVATCSIGGAPRKGPFPAEAPPADLDWDFWLGQAPRVDYTRERCHGSFRWWLEYSGGKMTDWGAHHIDIAQWALGHEEFGPVEIQAEGYLPLIRETENFDPVAFFAGRQRLPNGFNTATEFKITLAYGDGARMIVQHGPDNGIWLEGDEGRIFVSRGKLTGKPVEEFTDTDRQWLQSEVERLYGGHPPSSHMDNFFARVADRGRPISDVWTHHRTMTSCHLCNIGLLLGRKLRWDPRQEDFVGDQQASALRSRPQRKPYAIED